MSAAATRLAHVPAAFDVGEAWQAACRDLAQEVRRAPRRGWRWMSVSAPRMPLRFVLGFRAKGPATLWDSPDGPRFATWGAAARIQATGRRRFAEIRRLADELLSNATGDHGPLVGGFAFAHGRAASAWSALGDATFTLPRWRYQLEPAGACLTLCLGPDDRNDEAADELHGLDIPSDPRPQAGTRGVRQLSPATWSRWVTRALRAIDDDQFKKLVLARIADVAAEGSFDVVDVLSKLEGRPNDGTCFALCDRDTAFIGLTPERLVRVNDREVSTEALAGTARGGERSSTLMRSPKNRREQQVVVEDVVARLAPYCENLLASSRPSLRATGNLVHLRTGIHGRLREGTHVLEVAEALHPTPAVAGWPAAPATRWLARTEPVSRGWYAGLVGWFDRAGNGDFAVAIRSALLCGAKAQVYAGCGIVPGSNAASEYRETALKQQPMLQALGVLP